MSAKKIKKSDGVVTDKVELLNIHIVFSFIRETPGTYVYEPHSEVIDQMHPVKKLYIQKWAMPSGPIGVIEMGLSDRIHKTAS